MKTDAWGFPVILHPDETERPDLQWCPSCGCNADIVTYEVELGINWRCRYCGDKGRLGSGWPEPTKFQPGFEE